MSNQPLLMQGEKLIFQNQASFSGGKVFREGDLFLTNQRLIWKKASALKAGLKAGGNLLVGVIAAAGKENYSIPLNTISAIGSWKKTGAELLTSDGSTYKFRLLSFGGSAKELDEKIDTIISYVQNFISNI